MATSSSPMLLLVAAVACFVVSVSAREAPRQPQTFGHFDGTFWIPGIGRFVPPKWGVHPFHANPITGAPGGVQVPVIGGVTTPRRYIPGLDNNIIPNPGFEIPIFPGAGGGGGAAGTGATPAQPTP